MHQSQFLAGTGCTYAVLSHLPALFVRSPLSLICSLRRGLQLLVMIDPCSVYLGRGQIYPKEEADKLPGGQ